MEVEKISYAKTVYGEEEINAVLRCLNDPRNGQIR